MQVRVAPRDDSFAVWAAAGRHPTIVGLHIDGINDFYNDGAGDGGGIITNTMFRSKRLLFSPHMDVVMMFEHFLTH